MYLYSHLGLHVSKLRYFIDRTSFTTITLEIAKFFPFRENFRKKDLHGGGAFRRLYDKLSSDCMTIHLVTSEDSNSEL